MKKGILVLLIAVTFGFLGSSLAFAEESQQRGQGMMMGGQGKSGGMGMMGMMQKDSVVATADGGVVVLAGPRLLKYDKDLTLVKEIEIPRGKKMGQGQGSNDQAQFGGGTFCGNRTQHSFTTVSGPQNPGSANTQKSNRRLAKRS